MSVSIPIFKPKRDIFTELIRKTGNWGEMYDESVAPFIKRNMALR